MMFVNLSVCLSRGFTARNESTSCLIWRPKKHRVRQYSCPDPPQIRCDLRQITLSTYFPLLQVKVSDHVSPEPSVSSESSHLDQYQRRDSAPLKFEAALSYEDYEQWRS